MQQLPDDQARLALQREGRSMRAHPLFLRAPTLAVLLDFLVKQADKGNQRRLNQYAVATGGLGLADDFDPRLSCNVRVQIGRLRTAIARYYRVHAPENGLCLHIEKGGYKISLVPFAEAYPDFFDTSLAPSTCGKLLGQAAH